MKASTKLSEILSLMAMPVAGRPGEWEVESRHVQGTTHRVRLGSEDGLYSCQCENWLFQAESKLHKGEEPFQVSTMCVHICAALFQEQVRRLTLRKP